ncbi:M16 family metallopeptidase [Candidatus Methylacidithermus pantelleriae]|uniref:Insulinase family protein n=1 Tax=Candidatus Methylacidithermus pantelleriae TaxID=2744239 RepID=A0A8J2BNT4_9BACT|nr:pitrilysin family protein [Candidatus Methylacidithermus pantelleriae]CAF0699255.1 Insulinase family protein [Candidatus Methylacidithermus pantelleriae]
MRKTFPLARALLWRTGMFLSFVAWLAPFSPRSTLAAPFPLPKGVRQGPSVEGITEYDLPNGLKVLLFPDPSRPTITVNVTYLVGSRNESYGETGMAHLLEHMLFKGTPRHPHIPQELTEHGAKPNATTSWDRTNFFETFPATDANLDWALDLEADRMVHAILRKDEFEREMTVVRNEFEMGENAPWSVLFKHLMAAAYRWHNYGKPVIGARSDIENVSLDRLAAFYRRYYRPDNCVLILSGAFDPGHALALVVKHFATIPRPSGSLPQTHTEEPSQEGLRRVVVERAGGTPLVMVGVHIPAASHPDIAPLEVLADALGDTPSGRLYHKLVETQKASSVGDDVLALREPGMAVFYAEGPAGSDAHLLEQGILQTLDEAMRSPPSEEEVARIRRKLLKEMELALANSERIGLYLSEFIAAGDWRLFFLRRDWLEKVSAAQVARVARTYLPETNRTVAVYVPAAQVARVEIPHAPDLAALLRDYRGKGEIEPGEALDPDPSSLEARIQRAVVSPGIATAVLTKRTRADLVHACLSLQWGTERNLRGTSTVARLAAHMLSRGTTQHSRQELEDELDRLKARVSWSSEPGGITVQMESPRTTFFRLLELVTEMLRKPSFSSSEWEQLKAEELTELEQERSEPTEVAYREALRHMNPYPQGDVRYVPTFEEEIKEVQKVSLEEAKAFYGRFYGANHGEVSVVGNLGLTQVSQKLQSLFGGWESREPFEPIFHPLVQNQTLRKVLPIPDKPNAAFVACQALALSDENPDYPALVLGTYILGGGFLSSRLALRIRAQEGLSYHVGAHLELTPKDSTALFLASAIAAPQNVAKVEKAYFEEVTRILKEGVRKDELAKAQEGWLQMRRLLRSNDRELATLLATRARWGRTLAWDGKLEAQIRNLSVAEVTAALRKYLDPNRMSVFLAGDLARLKTALVPILSPPGLARERRGFLLNVPTGPYATFSPAWEAW